MGNNAPFFYLPSLGNRGGPRGVAGGGLASAPRRGGGRGEGEKEEGVTGDRFPAAARAEVERSGLATMSGGRRWPWAGVLEARRWSRRGEGEGGEEILSPSLPRAGTARGGGSAVAGEKRV